MSYTNREKPASSPVRIGSLFDGSGGFPLAASLCGIEPVWASEVEPYPIAVTRSRFPGMKHLGSVTDINGAEIEPVDIITFGSPCQGLSVSGKRRGLADERSGLFTEAIRIIKEMREATDGIYPAFALWENVVGAFSSNKGKDLRIVLEELIKIVEPGAVMPPVPAKGWPYADCYCGDGWSLAYRVFDAQFWGVPQRRRRIHLVLDLRGGRAGKVLFEREGLRGDFTAGGTSRQGIAGDVAPCAGEDDREGNCVAFHLLQDPISIENKTPCLTSGNSDHGQAAIGVVLCEPVYCLQGNGIDRADTAGCNGKGVKENICYTLNTVDRPAVAYAMQAFGEYSESEKASAMKARDYKDATDLVVECAGVDCRNMTEYPELYPTLQAKPNGGQSLNFSGAVRVRYIVRRLTPTECARLQGFADNWGRPDRKDDFTDEEYRFWLDVRNTHAAINGRAVKGYTKGQMLKWYNKLHTDSAEYKMWGNGICLNTALYCMQGIAEALEESE